MNFSKTYKLLLGIVMLCSFSIFASQPVSGIEAKIKSDKTTIVQENVEVKVAPGVAEKLQWIEEQNRLHADHPGINPNDLQDYELMPLNFDSRSSQFATVSASYDSWSSEAAWTVVLDLYGDGYLYYACLDDDGYYCTNSGWQYSACGDNCTDTNDVYFFEGYNYYILAYDSYGDGGTTVTVTGDDGAVWASHSSSSGTTQSDAFTTPAPAATTTIAFLLEDSWGDGWNGNYIQFGSDALTIDSGSSAQFNYELEDGSYSYDYVAAGSYASENYFSVYSWDGYGWVLISSGAGSSGSATYTFNVGGPPPVEGCTDADAENYNADADVDDGSCTYNGGCSSASQCACGDFETSGQCKPCSYFCDGSSEFGNAGWGPDCSDGSDEGEQCCGGPDGGDYSGTDCADLYDCNGAWNGDAVVGCDDVCGSGAVNDECGVCGGDGSSCAASSYTVVVGGGSYDSEITWDINGGDLYPAGTYTVGLEDGTHTFNGYDSWGDGWNGASASIYSDAGLIAVFVVEGSSGSWAFDTPGTVIVAGCTLSGAPNYNSDATIDDGSCEFFPGADLGYWYGSFYAGCYLDCTTQWYSCDTTGNGLSDAIGDGVCSNDSTGYYGADFSCFDCDGGDCNDCAGECNGSAVVDECGVCGGDGIADGACDCDGNVSDCAGDCGGSAVVDECGDCGGDGIDEGACDCAGNVEICGECGGSYASTDFNTDCDVNVLDVILLVGAVVNGDDLAGSDLNGDGATNVIDVVWLVNSILSPRTADATDAIINIIDNNLSLIADGYIGGVQMTLSHDNGFELDLTDNALVVDYKTEGTSTTLVVVAPEDELLFTANKSFEIVSMIVANSTEEIAVDTITAEFGLSAAYPNPFNPSTTVSLTVPSADYVSVKVYNLMGQVVGVLADGMMEANVYSFTWDASNMSSGVYLVKAESSSSVDIQKVMLVK